MLLMISDEPISTVDVVSNVSVFDVNSIISFYSRSRQTSVFVSYHW